MLEETEWELRIEERASEDPPKARGVAAALASSLQSPVSSL
jgi:hypothetical protein